VIIADTSIWIEFFRRRDSPTARALDSLLAQGQVGITGIVLAEVLQGARDDDDFRRLADLLTGLPFLKVEQETWVRAGELSFRLRGQGPLVPLTDLVLAAVALEGSHEVFTLDDHFQRVPGLRVYEGKAG